LSIGKAAPIGPPGYGFTAKSAPDCWTDQRDAKGFGVFRSARMVMRVGPGNLPNVQEPQAMLLEYLNLDLRNI